VSTLVVGSVALDTVETPFGRADNVLGGTAMYFSLAASLFTDVNLVGVVGEDFPGEALQTLQERRIDLAGLQRRSGETFRWVGQYDFDMNVAHTLDTQLNVFETFHPTIPDHYRDSRFVFLGNIHPSLQLEVLAQVTKPEFVALDTMNFWISGAKDELTQVMRRVDAVIINEGEIREYTEEYNVLEAARHILELGPRYVVLKRGEYGAILFEGDRIFAAPAFPTWDVRDTTGAGDSFAGGFVGYLDSCQSLDHASFRSAVVYGSCLASFTVEDFSIRGLMKASRQSLRDRYLHLADITHIEAPSPIQERDLVSEGV